MEAAAATPTHVDDVKFSRWRKSLSYITGIGLSDEERAMYDKTRKVETEQAQCIRCDEWKDSLMKYSPGITFMMKNLEKAGCKVEPEHIVCAPCEESRSGGFAPDVGILLCANKLANKRHQEDTLLHEMIHMFDQCRFKVDWSDCRHHACSEVRAASLSGDCRWTREIKRGFFTFTKQHQACVKRRAILSVQANPCCQKPGEAENAVNQVFDSCFSDTRPFDEVGKAVILDT